MPTYQYACTDPSCAERFERVQAFTDPAISECPVCGHAVRKVYGSVGVVFKGSGFYRNDSRAGNKSGDGLSSKSDSSSKTESSKSDSSSTPSKSESGSSKSESGSSKAQSGSSTTSSESSSSKSTSGSSSAPKSTAGAS